MKKMFRIISLGFSFILVNLHGGGFINCVINSAQELTVLGLQRVWTPTVLDEVGSSQESDTDQTGYFYVASLIYVFRITNTLTTKLLSISGNFTLKMISVGFNGLMNILEQYFMHKQPYQHYPWLICKVGLHVGALALLFYFVPVLLKTEVQVLLSLACFAITYGLQWAGFETKYSPHYYLFLPISWCIFGSKPWFFVHLDFSQEPLFTQEFNSFFITILRLVSFAIVLGFRILNFCISVITEFVFINFCFGFSSSLFNIKLNFTKFKQTGHKQNLSDNAYFDPDITDLSESEQDLAKTLSQQLSLTRHNLALNTKTLITSIKQYDPSPEALETETPFYNNVKKVLDQVQTNVEVDIITIGPKDIDQLSGSWGEFLVIIMSKFTYIVKLAPLVWDIISKFVNSILIIAPSVAFTYGVPNETHDQRSELMKQVRQAEQESARMFIDAKNSFEQFILILYKFGIDLLGDCARRQIRRIISAMQDHHKKTGRVAVLYIEGADRIIGDFNPGQFNIDQESGGIIMITALSIIGAEEFTGRRPDIESFQKKLVPKWLQKASSKAITYIMDTALYCVCYLAQSSIISSAGLTFDQGLIFGRAFIRCLFGFSLPGNASSETSFLNTSSSYYRADRFVRANQNNTTPSLYTILSVDEMENLMFREVRSTMPGYPLTIGLAEATAILGRDGGFGGLILSSAQEQLFCPPRFTMESRGRLSYGNGQLIHSYTYDIRETILKSSGRLTVLPL